MTSEQKKKQFAKSKTTLFHEPNVSRAYFPRARPRHEAFTVYPRAGRVYSDGKLISPVYSSYPSELSRGNYKSTRSGQMSLFQNKYSKSLDESLKGKESLSTSLDDDIDRPVFDDFAVVGKKLERVTFDREDSKTSLEDKCSKDKRFKKINKLFKFKLFNSKSSSTDEQLSPFDSPSSPDISSPSLESRFKNFISTTIGKDKNSSV